LKIPTDSRREPRQKQFASNSSRKKTVSVRRTKDKTECMGREG